jgi:hypothetical protein
MCKLIVKRSIARSGATPNEPEVPQSTLRPVFLSFSEIASPHNRRDRRVLFQKVGGYKSKETEQAFHKSQTIQPGKVVVQNSRDIILGRDLFWSGGGLLTCSVWGDSQVRARCLQSGLVTECRPVVDCSRSGRVWWWYEGLRSDPQQDC